MIPIERVRELCRELQGLELLCYADGTPYVWLLNGREFCKYADYKPDIDVLQAAELKARLVELGISYDISCDSKSMTHNVAIWTYDDRTLDAMAESEEAALAAAVAEMVQNGKEQ